MTSLPWRPVRTLELNDKLIPDPNAQHIKLDRLHSVRVAIDGSFLHIDPRPEGEWKKPGEFTIYTVPASNVLVMQSQEQVKSGKVVGF
ncbi:hypothetical protein [Streptomyces platensis]|uniref:hypothetical protein n=1 Tax=Streptomyces platensis TaxID=58346 RepID=UPI003866C172|nr:hypothetical protein OG962_00350 [Streptomyces platensis]